MKYNLMNIHQQTEAHHIQSGLTSQENNGSPLNPLPLHTFYLRVFFLYIVMLNTQTYTAFCRLYQARKAMM